MSDIEYINNIAVLENTPFYAESLLHSLEQAARGIGLYVNANKKEFLCFNQKRSHLYFKWQASDISWPVHIPWQ